MVMAAVFLFVSCNQYENPNEEVVVNKFDYSVFNEFKNSPIFNNILNDIKLSEIKFNIKSTLNKNGNALKIVNSNLGSDLTLPDSVLKLTDYSAKEILNIGLENKWISQVDVSLIKSFTHDVQSENFDTAVSKYENKVLGMNLSVKEFAKKNAFLNTIKLYNYQNQNVLSKSIMKGKAYRVDEG